MARSAGSKNAEMVVNCTTVPFGSRLMESGTVMSVKNLSFPMSASKTLLVVLKNSVPSTKTLSSISLICSVKKVAKIAMTVRRRSEESFQAKFLKLRMLKEAIKSQKQPIKLLLALTKDSTCS